MSPIHKKYTLRGGAQYGITTV